MTLKTKKECPPCGPQSENHCKPKERQVLGPSQITKKSYGT